MSGATTSPARITKRRAILTLISGFFVSAWLSGMLVDWIFDGPEWLRIVVWVVFFVGWMTIGLLFEDEEPPQRPYQRMLARRGLGHRSTDD